MKKVVAKALGLWEGNRVRPGQELLIDDDVELRPWMQLVTKKSDKPSAPTSARRPSTLSELQRAAFPAVQNVGGLLE